MIVSQTEESIKSISSTIARGGVIAFRTDTFYGLGADPFNHNAVLKIKNLKGRDDHKPILIVISDRDQVDRFVVRQSAICDQLSQQFWPGPLTIVSEAKPEVPFEITEGSQTVGLRLPADDDVRALVAACGGALTATSANPSGKLPAKTAIQVAEYFGESLDLIVDGGAANSDQPSTVISVRDSQATLIREGVIAWVQIENLLNQVKG